MTGTTGERVKVSALLEPPPRRWGLRGDPHVWEALRLRLADEDMPGTVDEVMRLVHAAFTELTGADLAGERYHERLAKLAGGVGARDRPSA